MIRIGALALGTLAILLFAACGDDDPLSSSSATGSSSRIVAPATPIPKPVTRPAPGMSINPSKDYVATLHTQNGRMAIKLFAKEVPNTVNNFVYLSRTGFYDGVTFHRVLPGFMAQSGDPTGTGMGGPGYQFDDEFHPDLRHSGPGVLSMANSGQNTNGSQFFITFVETPSLDGLNPDGSAKDCANPYVSCHAVFGKIVEGMDVLGSISLRDPSTATTPGDVILAIDISEDGVTLGTMPN